MANHATTYRTPTYARDVHPTRVTLVLAINQRFWLFFIEVPWIIGSNCLRRSAMRVYRSTHNVFRRTHWVFRNPCCGFGNACRVFGNIEFSEAYIEFSGSHIVFSEEFIELSDAYTILQNNILAIQIRVKKELRKFV